LKKKGMGKTFERKMRSALCAISRLGGERGLHEESRREYYSNPITGKAPYSCWELRGVRKGPQKGGKGQSEKGTRTLGQGKRSRLVDRPEGGPGRHAAEGGQGEPSIGRGSGPFHISNGVREAIVGGCPPLRGEGEGDCLERKENRLGAKGPTTLIHAVNVEKERRKTKKVLEKRIPSPGKLI